MLFRILLGVLYAPNPFGAYGTPIDYRKVYLKSFAKTPHRLAKRKKGKAKPVRKKGDLSLIGYIALLVLKTCTHLFAFFN